MKTFYFIGIAGTAMASVAGALKQLGHHVLGSDAGVYPPMSDFLQSRHIPYVEGYAAANIDAAEEDAARKSSKLIVVVGNAVSRGNPEVEATLNRKLQFTSLAGLVGQEMIAGNTSVVVTGTHGKTTTTSLAAWVFEAAGRSPGFLIGGIPENFGQGCRSALAEGVFITEGDEYDTAFFDKRSKFVHYRPDIAILNNIEFDHADIFSSLEEILRSFRSFVNLVPGTGVIVANGDDLNVRSVVADAHAPVEYFGLGQDNDWCAAGIEFVDGSSAFDVTRKGTMFGRFSVPMAGEFNVLNALAVIAAASAAGLTPDEIRKGLTGFLSIKRRMEVIGEFDGITVIDDFAHHPTAVRLTLEALAAKYPGRRIVALFEPRSNTTTRNIFQAELADAFGPAEIVVVGSVNRPERYPEDERLDTAALTNDLIARGKTASYMPSVDDMIQYVLNIASSGDVIALLSNGKFGGAHRTLTQAFEERSAPGS